MDAADPLELLGPATRAWFGQAFVAPTPVQRAGLAAIVRGGHALLCAPTGSGKTLAAFLFCIDRLGRRRASAPAGVRVLYISPLKALAYDIERNLRAPLAGIERAAATLGIDLRPVRVAVRTGDTPARERRQLLGKPGEILITTPESLYLLLGTGARAVLGTIDTVIVDEIHALAPSKRGAHLALSLERLDALCKEPPQRIGLSATQRPLDEVARFLAGGRPVQIVDAAEPPLLDLSIEVPADEMGNLWPSIDARVLELVHAHRSTIVFANSRRLCERLAQRLNELDAEKRGAERPRALVRAHHGSVARTQREEIEDQLKSGALRGIVATSSLELGIDMGAVDLVIQLESPGSVARGLQRIGRAGHQVGARSSGRIFPKHPGDLLEAALVARRMLDGEVEPLRVISQPLDVLAQQIVAMVSVEEWQVAELGALVRQAYSFNTLSDELLRAVLDMLTGRYPSDAFTDLRPRLVWDRLRDRLSARRDARLVALTNGGTIPDRGLYAVHLGEGGPRVGELDEEMVYESRVGQVFLLGASSWRITAITRDRVLVDPAPGEPGRMPFWRGEGPGRPLALGRALGAFVRTLGELPPKEAQPWLERECALTPRAAQNLLGFVSEQQRVAGTLPTDRSITIERFRDELGDWRVCILSPFGARVHAPLALAIEARLGGARGSAVQPPLWGDDGIVLRFADSDERPRGAALLPSAAEVEELVLGELARSSLFASRFRENAARALLLPRRRIGTRTPLWAQRLRAQNLLEAAAKHTDFPIVLETYRECLHDVFDLPALRELLLAIERHELEVVEVETAAPSPFARTLAFAYVAAYLYAGDAPLAERKAQALTLDRNLLRDLLGQEELRELLDPLVLDEVEAELQGLASERHARHFDALHDLLRRVGDLTLAELRARSDGDVEAWLAALVASGRAVRATVAGQERWIAVEDVARYRDALGVPPPPNIAAVWLKEQPQPQSLAGLLARFARAHGPFTTASVAQRFGIAAAQVEAELRALAASGKLVQGELRAGVAARQWCDAEVLRSLRRRTLARLRHQVAPVDGAAVARFLPRWHGVGAGRGGIERLREVIEQLEGNALPFSELERAILPARVADFRPRMLDELGALGEIVWVGRGGLGDDDGKVALYRRERVALLLDPPPAEDTLAPLERALLADLETRGASFFAQLAAAADGALEEEVAAALWSLVWAGLVTNDTFAPLRALIAPSRSRRAGSLTLRMAGRWSKVAQLRGGATATEQAYARALMLVGRYGVVSREAAVAEALEGGFAAIAAVLRAMEEAGRIRRGHFVEGLTGAQFAHAAAVDRLRASHPLENEGAGVVVLAAVDPANPFGAILPWPVTEANAPRPRRAAGAVLVLARGRPVFFLEAGGHQLRFFADQLDEDLVEAAFAGLRSLAARQRHRQLRIEKVNGVAALRSEHATRFEQAGFRVEPGALTLSVAG